MMIRCERATEEDDHAIGHLVDKQSLFAKLVVLTANLDTAEWPDGLL